MVRHGGWPRAILPHQLCHGRARNRCRFPELDAPVTPQAPIDETLRRGVDIANIGITDEGFQGEHDLRALVRG